MKKHTLLLACAMRILLNLIALPQWGRLIGGGFAEIDEEVAAVLVFVLSHTTFLAAQDDETGRCLKVVFKSPVTSDW